MSLDLQQFRRGWFVIDAVQLTEANAWQVFEPTGRNKAEFGDWVYRTPGGGFRTRPDVEFRDLFQPVIAEEATR